MEHMKLGEMDIYWLSGGEIHLDGGAMFGVVPRVLWSKKYPVNDQNQVLLRTDPILIQTAGKNILIESGMGNDKLSDKQLNIFGVTEQSEVEKDLNKLGLCKKDIDMVLMTHLHFDHACGLTRWEGDRLVPAFPDAVHVVNHIEWEEMKSPNIRSRSTYWEENWKPITDLVRTYDKAYRVIDGIELIHTGGHSRGHAIIRLESKGEKAYHLADILPTHAHQNPLWVMAYDDYPMNSIYAKQKWIQQAVEEDAWLLFYHDPYVRALKWDQKGNIVEQLKRTD
ncbi:MAG: MBL fold metallo-hydrolase [Bacillaceae bacterium]|nr:MBL fold metallo-hydrolase [Bacillaceae bacterium]